MELQDDLAQQEADAREFIRLVGHINNNMKSEKIVDIIVNLTSEDLIKTTFAECGLKATKPNAEIWSKTLM